MLIDFFEKVDDFSEAGKSIGFTIQYFALTIPFVVDQLSPILILLSGVITLGILNHNHELVALKAGGIPLRTILRPILVAGIFFTIVFLASAQWILPPATERTNKIWFEEVKGKVQLGIHRNGRYYFKGKEGFYSFKWNNREKLVFNDFSYSKWTTNHNLQFLVSAQSAFFDGDSWVLANGQTQQITNGAYETDPFEQRFEQLPENPNDFLIPQYDVSALSITDLFVDAHNQESDEQTAKAWAAFFGRLSYIFLGFPLLLVGLPILLISYARWGKDLSVAIPISCGMAFIAWGVWGAMQSLAAAGAMSPLLAGTAIHLLFALSGIYLLRKQNQ